MRGEREEGLDLLRISSALFVVAAHMFPLCAGINQEPAYTSALPELFFYALVLCSVNCFGMISGYVGYREEAGPVRISAMLLIWLQLFLYRLLLLVLPSFLGLTGQQITLTEIFLPVTRRVNWYITAYFEMMLLAPAIQSIVRSSTRRSNAVMMLCLFVFVSAASLLPAFLDSDPYQLQGGYGWAWLSVLYFWGCSIKKFGYFRGIPARRFWVLAIASLLLTAAWRWLGTAVMGPDSFPGRHPRLFYSFPSPTLVMTSVGLLMLCAGARLPQWLRRPIRTAASASLGVFLIHTSSYWIIEPRLSGFTLPTRIGTLRCFCVVLVIAIPCILIDLLRQRLFAILRIRRLTDGIQARLLRLFARAADRLLP